MFNPKPAAYAPAPLIEPGHTFGSITDKISGVVLGTRTPLSWFIVVSIGLMLMGGLGLAVTYLLIKGTGIWGVNIPVGWGFAIINFVWWIGIGHAGTLISAILLLLKQGWRTSINRFAEGMTIFAVMCAGLFPLIHTGRPWLAAYWLFPYPNRMSIWPQFRSPLIWDVFAVSTYFTVSLLFWYVGLIPDLATLRDKAKSTPVKMIYGVLSLGWRGSARHWQRYEHIYLLLAGLSTPLGLSVHTVVSFDFAIGIIPGWHATIFPPYFVAGAIFSGIGMVFTIIIPLRKYFKLEHMVTINDLDAAAKLCLFTSMVVGLAYLTEFQVAWMSGNKVEQEYFWNLVFGQRAWAAWIMLICNMVLPLSLFSQALRRNTTWLFILSIFINIGMWFERFVIVIPSLSHEFEPWQWGTYAPTWVDYSILLGSFGWFFMWFLLFIKQLPVIAIAEVKEIIPPKLRATHPHEDNIDHAGRHLEYEPDTPGEYA
jgi:molybdopterin-containing oxidoreductase family membrane subunit